MNEASYILKEVLLELGVGTTPKLSQNIILYRGDKGIIIRFKIKDSQYSYNGKGYQTDENGNILSSIFDDTRAVFSIYKPNGETYIPKVENITINNGVIDFLIDDEFCDEITEVGRHSFQLHIFDMNGNRVSFEPFGFEVREALVKLGIDGIVGDGTVNQAVVRVATVDGDGEYIEYVDITKGYDRTNWVTGDLISADRLNNMESAINLSFVSINETNKRIDDLKLSPEITIRGFVNDHSELASMVETAEKNDAWVVNNDTRHVWVWSGVEWVDVGPYLVIYGPTGPQGEQGEKGDTGDKGETGPQGLQGEKGEKGDQGEKGDTGAAFTYDMFSPEQLEALRGPQGPQGLQGPTGLTGDSIDVIYSDEAPENLSALWVVDSDDEVHSGEVVTSESIRKIELVTEYPENPKEGVLYIKVGELL